MVPSNKVNDFTKLSTFAKSAFRMQPKTNHRKNETDIFNQVKFSHLMKHVGTNFGFCACYGGYAHHQQYESQVFAKITIDQSKRSKKYASISS